LTLRAFNVQQDQCDRKLSTRWQRALHIIMEKSTEPQLYLDKIENLNVNHPDWPFALVRLGKAYLLLQDLHGALEQFQKVLGLIQSHKDEKFARYVEGLREYIKVIKSPFVQLSYILISGSLPVRTLRLKKVPFLFDYCLCDLTDTIYRCGMGETFRRCHYFPLGSSERHRSI
jgi:hypothetical protein